MAESTAVKLMEPIAIFGFDGHVPQGLKGNLIKVFLFLFNEVVAWFWLSGGIDAAPQKLQLYRRK